MLTKVGEYLKSERKLKRISLSQLEELTKIRQKQLIAVEESDWSQFPSKTYTLGVIKAYSRALKLDEEKMMAFFRREYELSETTKFKQKIRLKEYTPISRKIFLIISLVFFLLFSMYFANQIRLYVSPPAVEILEPTKDHLKRVQKFTVAGKTEKNAIVEVNGKLLPLDEKNIFSIQIPLVDNPTVVKIVVTGANGKKTVVEKKYYKE